MSRRIFKDVEEALSRAVRSITFDDKRTVDLTVLQDVYDVFTGEVKHVPIEPNFYDSSADAQNIQYPHFFVRLMATREDRFTGRVIPQYGKEVLEPIPYAPKAYNIILHIIDGEITAPGNVLTTTNFQVRKIQPGQLIRVLTGNNIGTYTVLTVTPGAPSTITVSNTLLNNLPPAYFETTTNDIYFTTRIDLNTIRYGDIFTDASSRTFQIIEVCPEENRIRIETPSTIDLSINSNISRIGNVFTTADTSIVAANILDPTQPVMSQDLAGMLNQNTSAFTGVSPAIPIDAYYLVRIDSKERLSHIEILNRMWEEFNPPRTGLPTIIREEESGDQAILDDIPKGGGTVVRVCDASSFKVNDPVFLINDFHPTKSPDGKFEKPFSSVITSISPTNQIILADIIPDTFQVCNNTRIVSNAFYYLLFFHFVDHKTKDIEGAQYWVHEFTFWVQFWIDRQGRITDFGTVQNIDVGLIDLNTNTTIFP